MNVHILIAEDAPFLECADDAIIATTAAHLLRVPLSYIQRLIDERALPSTPDRLTHLRAPRRCTGAPWDDRAMRAFSGP